MYLILLLRIILCSENKSQSHGWQEKERGGGGGRGGGGVMYRPPMTLEDLVLQRACSEQNTFTFQNMCVAK